MPYDYEDDGFEASRYDYNREAYGDKCPACGTLRWQADCPKCEGAWQDTQDPPATVPDASLTPLDDHEGPADGLPF